MNDLLTESFQFPRREVQMNALRNSGDLGLDKYFKQVEDIEKEIDKLNGILKKLQDENEESKSITKAASMKAEMEDLKDPLVLPPQLSPNAIKQRMAKYVDEVGRIALSAKSKIEQLDRENLANREKPGCGKGTGVDRTRTASTVSLKKKLRDKLSEFQILRQTIHQEYRDVVERRVFTVTGQRADEDVIDHLIETGEGEQIFQKAIQEQGRGQIMSTVAEIHERHETVKELETKLLDLQQIFLDIAVLVDAQGEILDNIESQVSNAVDHVQSGNKALQKTKNLQKNSRKWTCIAILILLIIIIITVVSVIKPWTSKNGA